jgi:hypothetical protein
MLSMLLVESPDFDKHLASFFSYIRNAMLDPLASGLLERDATEVQAICKVLCIQFELVNMIKTEGESGDETPVYYTEE